MMGTSRLERRVRRVGRETRLGIRGILPFLSIDIVGCADEGGASFANDGLRKLSPSYGPSSHS